MSTRKSEPVKPTMNLVIKGKLSTPSLTETRKGTHPKDKRDCYRLSIKDGIVKDADEIRQAKEMYMNVEDSKYIPKWFAEFKKNKAPEYINFKSDYPIVVRDFKSNDIVDLSTVINGAEGYFNIKIKWLDEEGSSVGCYCTGFKMVKNGTPFDDFGDCDF